MKTNKDLIDRAKAIAETWKEPTYTDPMNVLTEIRDRLRALPSEQSIIIRCKECINNRNCDIQYHAQAGDEFWCAAAERREHGSD